MKQVLQLIRPFREMRKIVAFSFALLAFLGCGDKVVLR